MPVDEDEDGICRGGYVRGGCSAARAMCVYNQDGAEPPDDCDERVELVESV